MSKITEKELEILFPETTVELVGHDFNLKPFSFSETAIVTGKLTTVMNLIVEPELTIDKLIIGLLKDCHDGVRDIIALCYQIDAKIVDKFDMKTVTIAIREIIKINSDFFTEEVMGELPSDLIDDLDSLNPEKDEK